MILLDRTFAGIRIARWSGPVAPVSSPQVRSPGGQRPVETEGSTGTPSLPSRRGDLPVDGDSGAAASVRIGPQPGDDPLWGWRDFNGRPTVVLRCALCGRPCGPKTSDLFFNLHAPLGRQLVVEWHPGCYLRDPLKEETYWEARQDRERWGRFLDTIATRGGGRIGPGRVRS